MIGRLLCWLGRHDWHPEPIARTFKTTVYVCSRPGCVEMEAR